MRAEAALLDACKEGSISKVLAALDDGACAAEASDERGWTGLHWGCYAGSAVVVKEMLEQGVDVEAVGEDGETALLVACGRGAVDVVELLLAREDGAACIHTADLMGTYPLHSAAASGSMMLTGLLLKHGASPSVRNAVHLTPKDIAVAPAADLLNSVPATPALPAGVSSSLMTFLALAAQTPTPLSQSVTRKVAAALLSHTDAVDSYLERARLKDVNA